MKRALIFIVVILSVAVSTLYRLNQSKKSEINRLVSNQSALFADIEFYRTQSNLSAASVERLTLTKRELEKYNAELVQTVGELGIKIKRLEAASVAATKTELDIIAPLRDTIIFVEAEPVLSQSFEWSDNWVNINGVIRENEVDCHVQSTDTLVQAVYRVPRKFLFIRWGTKSVRQDIVSKNPHTNIVYSEYIEIKKNNTF